MKTNFIVNDYVIIWNLLFGASISENVYKLKQKIWEIYKKEYNEMYKDMNLIIEDYKNFIPNDDTIYNIVLKNEEFKKIKKQAEKYRLEIMKIWDKNKKTTQELMDKIIRKKAKDINIFIVPKDLNIIEYKEPNNIFIGKEIDENNNLKILLDINKKYMDNNIKKYGEKDLNIKNAILELAIINEYATKLSNRSCYQSGTPLLINYKKSLYPYWLMYLGIPKDKFKEYMERDKMIFDENKYAYEKEFKKMDIEEFIDFCIRNQRYMINEKKQQPEIIEII